jgi:antitoxin (DNA-binding transcriptional repressor) of toxin-antitoxin stability system
LDDFGTVKEGFSMIVSSTEVQNDFKKYVDLASEQDIVIMRDGLPVARLLGMKNSATLLSERLVGLVPRDVNEELAKTERLARQ